MIRFKVFDRYGEVRGKSSDSLVQIIKFTVDSSGRMKMIRDGEIVPYTTLVMRRVSFDIHSD